MTLIRIGFLLLALFTMGAISGCATTEAHFGADQTKRTRTSHSPAEWTAGALAWLGMGALHAEAQETAETQNTSRY